MKRILYQNLPWFLACLLYLGLLPAAQAVLTATATMSNPNPMPGETVSVTYLLSENEFVDPNGLESMSTGDILNSVGIPVVSGVKGTIPHIDYPPGPFTNRVYVETGITIPAGLPPGDYRYQRDFMDNVSNTNGGAGVGATFTISGPPPAPPPPVPTPATINAQLLAVSVTPVHHTASQGRSLTLSLTWRVTTSTGALINPITVLSENGVLNDLKKGEHLERINVSGTLIIPETLLITIDEIQQALDAGLEEMVFSREFTAGDSTKSAEVRISLNGAFLSGITVSTGVSTITLGQTSVVPLIWTYRVTQTGSPQTLNIRSDGGAFSDPGGTILGQVNQSLGLQRQIVSGVFSETISVPGTITHQAFNNGYNRVLFTRQFSDGKNSITATASLQIIAPGSDGKLDGAYLDLAFEGGSTDKTITARESLKAVAELTSSGVGRVAARWQIARPPFARINPVFTTIQVIQDIASGKVQKRYTSPTLPVDEPGIYLLRFAMTSPVVDSAPVIRYRVIKAGVKYRIQLLNPPAGLRIHRKSAFSWLIRPGVGQSTLQIFPADAFSQTCNNSNDEQPLTGMALGTGSGSVRLSPIVANKLQMGRQYCWRVQALSNGREVAVSGSRHFVWLRDGALSKKKPIVVDGLRMLATGMGPAPKAPPVTRAGAATGPFVVDGLRMLATGVGPAPKTPPATRAGAATGPFVVDGLRMLATGVGPASKAPPATRTGTATGPFVVDGLRMLATGVGPAPKTPPATRAGAATGPFVVDGLRMLATGLGPASKAPPATSTSIDLRKTTPDPYKNQRAPESQQDSPSNCQPSAVIPGITKGLVNSQPVRDCMPTTRKNNTGDLKDDPYDKGPQVQIIKFHPNLSYYGVGEKVTLKAAWQYGDKVILYELVNGVRKEIRKLRALPSSQLIDLGVMQPGSYRYELDVSGKPAGRLQIARKETVLLIKKAVASAFSKPKKNGLWAQVSTLPKTRGDTLQFKKMPPIFGAKRRGLLQDIKPLKPSSDRPVSKLATNKPAGFGNALRLRSIAGATGMVKNPMVGTTVVKGSKLPAGTGARKTKNNQGFVSHANTGVGIKGSALPGAPTKLKKCIPDKDIWGCELPVIQTFDVNPKVFNADESLTAHIAVSNAAEVFLYFYPFSSDDTSKSQLIGQWKNPVTSWDKFHRAQAPASIFLPSFKIKTRGRLSLLAMNSHTPVTSLIKEEKILQPVRSASQDSVYDARREPSSASIASRTTAAGVNKSDIGQSDFHNPVKSGSTVMEPFGPKDKLYIGEIHVYPGQGSSGNYSISEDLAFKITFQVAGVDNVQLIQNNKVIHEYTHLDPKDSRAISLDRTSLKSRQGKRYGEYGETYLIKASRHAGFNVMSTSKKLSIVGVSTKYLPKIITFEAIDRRGQVMPGSTDRVETVMLHMRVANTETVILQEREKGGGNAWKRVSLAHEWSKPTKPGDIQREHPIYKRVPLDKSKTFQLTLQNRNSAPVVSGSLNVEPMSENASTSNRIMIYHDVNGGYAPWGSTIHVTANRDLRAAAYYLLYRPEGGKPEIILNTGHKMNPSKLERIDAALTITRDNIPREGDLGVRVCFTAQACSDFFTNNIIPYQEVQMNILIEIYAKNIKQSFLPMSGIGVRCLGGNGFIDPKKPETSIKSLAIGETNFPVINKGNGLIAKRNIKVRGYLLSDGEVSCKISGKVKMGKYNLPFNSSYFSGPDQQKSFHVSLGSSRSGAKKLPARKVTLTLMQPDEKEECRDEWKRISPTSGKRVFECKPKFLW